MLQKFRPILALSMVLTISLTATAQRSMPSFSYLGSLGDKLTATMLTCPAKIWPEYDWKNHNVISIEGPDRALVWRGSTGQVSDLEIDLIKPLIRPSLYSFAEFEGKNTVFINMTINGTRMTPYQILDLIVHEGFHRFAQSTWKQETNQRGTIYPVSAEPRLYRKMLFTRLREYLISGGQDQQTLRKAAYWMQEWKKMAPEETSLVTDAYEGTAKYMGVLGASIGAQGCDVTDEKLLAGTQSYSKSMGASLLGNRFSLDAEGYDVGGIAAFILRFVEKDTTWFAKVVAGQTPPEILLSDVEALKDQLNSDDEAKFRKTADSMNTQLAEMLGTTLSDLTDVKSARVTFSYKSYGGSYSPLAFIVPKNFPGLNVTVMAAERIFKIRENSITTSVSAVLLDSDRETSVCPEGIQWVEVPLTNITESDGIISVADPSVQGQVPGKHVIDKNGKHWYCLFE